MSVYRVGGNKSSQNVFPSVRPTLDLDFANSKTLDPRITFTRSSGGSYVGADGLIKLAGVNEARFDHDPETGESLGLLIEESRTNLVINSNNADPNGKQNIVTSLETIIDPTGSSSSVRKLQITDDAPSPSTYSVRWGSASLGDITSPYSGSVWAKSETGTVGVEIDTNDSTRNSFTLNATWQRISVSRNAITSPFQFFDIRVNDGQAGSSFYVWGVQLEKGAFPTSYIPTQGSTRTRAADNAQITGKNFSEWYRPEEWTIFSSSSTNLIGGNNASTQSPYVWGLTNLSEPGFNGYGVRYRLNSISYPEILGRSGSLVPGSGLSNNQFVSPRILYKSAGFIVDKSIGIAFNGVLGQTNPNLVFNLTFPNRFFIGRANTGGNSPFEYNGHIRRLTYFPKRLPNEQLIALTR
jgi:hypothetical protein